MFYRLKQLVKSILKQGIKGWYRVVGFFRKHGIVITTNGKKLLSYRDKHQGERCFLIGNSPSLTAEDLETIKDEKSMACNIIYRLFDKVSWRPTYYFISDVVAIYAVLKEGALDQITGRQLFVNSDAYRKMKGDLKNVVSVSCANQREYKVSKNILAYYIPAQATVMTFMIEMAIYMGFSEIYLLGVDCTNTFTAGHFGTDYTDKAVDEYNLKRMQKKLNRPDLTLVELGEERRKRSLDAYEKLKVYAEERGVKIYNATRGGALEVFTRVDFEKLFIEKSVEKNEEK